jgi:ketosteroid isomerase-like protein
MEVITQRFVAALDELHRDRTVSPLVDLFGEEATLSKIGIAHKQRGREGARTFWQQYRDVFDTVDAIFRQTAVGDDTAFLEWTSAGTLRDGNDFHYDGVSVLVTDGNAISAFRTYYDPTVFLPEPDGRPSAGRVHALGDRARA